MFPVTAAGNKDDVKLTVQVKLQYIARNLTASKINKPDPSIFKLP